MKLYSSILKRRKGIILFAAIFILPIVFILVISADTFSKRQKTTKNLLESNLKLSGISALEEFESEILGITDSILNPDSILNIRNLNINESDEFLKGIFILDQNLRLIYPKSADDSGPVYLSDESNWSNRYKLLINKADSLSELNIDYSSAIKLYESALQIAKNEYQKGLVLEGMAKTYRSAGNFKKAIEKFRELKNNYGLVSNRSGHPYGITSPIQIYYLCQKHNNCSYDRDSLAEVYGQLKNGYWLINSSVYEFFTSEYQEILLIQDEKGTSRYDQLLSHASFYETYLIPFLKEYFYPSIQRGQFTNNRFLVPVRDSHYLISVKNIRIDNQDDYFYAGMSISLLELSQRIIPETIRKISSGYDLEFILVDENKNDITTGSKVNLPEQTLTLGFNKLPLPWKFAAIQPEYEKLESSGRIQVIIYGFLFVLIITLMILGALLLIRDISREAESMMLRTQFIHNVSHELKTPLSLIRLYGETLLARKNLSEHTRREGLNIITKESERLSYMINNILDFSKIEMGKKEFNISTGSLPQVVEETLESYRYHLEKKGFTIEKEINDNLPQVSFDRTAVEGILINLFSNAIKYSRDIKHVKISLILDRSLIKLAVTDKGIGISDKEINRIFERFYRTEQTDGFEARGSGLGLTLVKHAVEEHGWELQVESKPGKGSSFNIIIPINRTK